MHSSPLFIIPINTDLFCRTPYRNTTTICEAWTEREPCALLILGPRDWYHWVGLVSRYEIPRGDGKGWVWNMGRFVEGIGNPVRRDAIDGILRWWFGNGMENERENMTRLNLKWQPSDTNLTGTLLQLVLVFPPIELATFPLPVFHSLIPSCSCIPLTVNFPSNNSLATQVLGVLSRMGWMNEEAVDEVLYQFWVQDFGVVVSGGSGKWAGDSDDEVTVRSSFMVHTLIHLILYNSDWPNGDDDTRASPIVRLVSSLPDQLLHSSSSVFSQKGKSVHTRARSGGGEGVSGVAGRITLSFCLFSPSLHNFRRWYRPWRGKVDNRLPWS